MSYRHSETQKNLLYPHWCSMKEWPIVWISIYLEREKGRGGRKRERKLSQEQIMITWFQAGIKIKYGFRSLSLSHLWRTSLHSELWKTQNNHVMRASLEAQTVKNPPKIQKTWVWFPGQEDPLEKWIAAHSSILACRILWTEKPGGLMSTGSHMSWTWLAWPTPKTLQ